MPLFYIVAYGPCATGCYEPCQAGNRVWALCDGMLRTLSGGEPSSNKWIILCAADKSVRYDMK